MFSVYHTPPCPQKLEAVFTWSHVESQLQIPPPSSSIHSHPTSPGVLTSIACIPKTHFSDLCRLPSGGVLAIHILAFPATLFKLVHFPPLASVHFLRASATFSQGLSHPSVLHIQSPTLDVEVKLLPTSLTTMDSIQKTTLFHRHCYPAILPGTSISESK